MTKSVKARDGKIYEYNTEVHDEYFCKDNVYIDVYGIVREFDKDRYILFNEFLLDLEEKTLRNLSMGYDDSFTSLFDDIRDIEVYEEEGNRVIRINNSKVIILDEDNRFIEYYDDDATEIYDDFLYTNDTLEVIELPNVETIGDNFLVVNRCLRYIDAPKVETIGEHFLWENEELESITLPKVQVINPGFISFNKKISTVYVPSLKSEPDNCTLFMRKDIKIIRTKPKKKTNVNA